MSVSRPSLPWGFRRELEAVAVAAGDEHGAAASLLCHRRRGEKIVGLVAGAPGIGEAAGRDKFRNKFELLDEFVRRASAAFGARFRSSGHSVGRRRACGPGSIHRRNAG